MMQERVVSFDSKSKNCIHNADPLYIGCINYYVLTSKNVYNCVYIVLQNSSAAIEVGYGLVVWVGLRVG